MAEKKPEEFVVGDIIKHSATTRYSGSPITEVKDIGYGQTQATFQNGEVVEFYNGVEHEMKE